jgi:hypothetical protein
VQASGIQRPADGLQDTARSWIVPVNADGIGMYCNNLALHCLDRPFGDHPDDTSGNSLGVDEDGGFMGASDQRTIRLVDTVGKDLRRKRDSRFAGSSLVL